MIITGQYYRHMTAARWLVLLGVALVVSFSSAANAQFWKNKSPQLLPEDQAFSVSVNVNNAGKLSVLWSVADDYYMYRDKFAVKLKNGNAELGELSFPKGVIEDDPEFGEVEVYFYNVELQSQIVGQGLIELELHGQGCNKPVGVCYPPIIKNLSLELPEGIEGATNIVVSENASEDRAASLSIDRSQSQSEKSFIKYLLAAFGTGLLLSFTPCVLPMIPILAGIIAGQQNASRLRSGWLAICYVAGTIVTYIFAGAVAGATGAQLQSWFQNIWVVGAMCLMLIALALSLFGAYRIELPSSLQTKLSETGKGGRSASLSSFVMGLISALIVGACVSPLLIGALGVAISKGDPVLGAGIMGCMALGMGVLLILFGFGAGWLLPRAGAWMQHIQVIFGLMMLGVVIYLLASFPFIPVLLLWAILFAVSGFYLWHVATTLEKPLIVSLMKAVASGLLLWGVAAGMGALTKGDDVLNPLANLNLASSSTASESRKISLIKTTQLKEVENELAKARAGGKSAMLDFYAEWCLDCKRMHRTTFKDQEVLAAIDSWHLIEVDVTENSELSKAVKQHFGVFGPPATLFFDSKGQEVEELRQYGYLNRDQFLTLVSEVETRSR